MRVSMNCKTVLLLTFLWNAANSASGNDDLKTVRLTANEVFRMGLEPLSTVHFQLSNITADVGFAVLQAHSQDSKLHVSLSKQWTPGSSSRGVNVGVLTLLSPSDTSASWYLRSEDNHTVNVMVVAHTYNQTEVVPGACNTELPLEVDPNMYLQSQDTQSTIEYAYANKAFHRGGKQENCEDTATQSELYYDIYAYFMEANNLDEAHYFESLEGLLTVDNITAKAVKIQTHKFNAGQTKIKVAGYPSHGVVYGIVVKSKATGSKVPYIPATTYSCSFNPESDNICTGKKSAVYQAVATLLAIVGIFICFAGHRYFRIEMFFFGFLALGLVTYVLVARFSTLSIAVQLIVASLGGVVGGGLWLMFWSMAGIPVLSVLLVGLVAGIVTSSVLFDYTPIGEMGPFKTTLTYGMSFVCGMLVLSVFLLAFTRKLSIISCALVGSFLFVMALDSYIPSTTFGYFFLISVRKMTISGYIQVISTLPFTKGDIMLCALWVILVVVGTLFQFYRERKRPDFPPCPYAEYRMRCARKLQALSSEEGDRANHNERSPLLSGPGPQARDEPMVQPL